MIAIEFNQQLEYAGAEWVERNLNEGPQMTPFTRRVADCVGDAFRGIYHIDDGLLFAKTVDWGNKSKIRIAIFGPLSSFDDGLLTRLYLNCLRFRLGVSVQGAKKDYAALNFYHWDATLREFDRQCEAELPGSLYQPEGLVRQYCSSGSIKSEGRLWYGHNASGFGVTKLSELVVNAHRTCTRVQLNGMGFGRVQAGFSKRDREDNRIAKGHPGSTALRKAAQNAILWQVEKP